MLAPFAVKSGIAFTLEMIVLTDAGAVVVTVDATAVS